MSSPEAGKRPIRVLLLDDEPLILLELSFAFEDAGVRPLTATSSEAALSHIDDHVIDAAVLDVNLGGGETCAQVAQKLADIGVPFIIHSGDLDRQGELIREFKAKIVPKPTPGHHVAETLLGLLRD